MSGKTVRALTCLGLQTETMIGTRKGGETMPRRAGEEE